MRLAVVGSRGITDKAFIWKAIDEYIDESNGDCEVIISGGARGVDSIAESWADAHGVPKSIWLADWDRFGKSAGYRRNVNIIESSTHVLAIYDGESRGTAHSIKLARDNFKHLKIITPKGDADE